MPTPVDTARQCFTEEAEQALDEAVAVARRRGHAQTTSLHLVSSLLSRPSSALRGACSRTRNNAYSTRVQFKALELCLGVSLDRLPSTPNPVQEPPISNSLMAAIKRSQANQRRQPENFHLYHPHQQQNQLSSSPSSITVVKVELRNLILSILDDPVVSRVFGESGFRSCEIKLAILRPLHRQMFRYPKYKGPPVFLCNLGGGGGGGDDELGSRAFSFPFVGFSGALDGEENCVRRIAEVMVPRDNIKGRRNPLLVGACAYEALRTFFETLQRRRGSGILPLELFGVGVVCLENEILRFVGGTCEESFLKLRFREVDKMVENCVGAGVVVNFGDLRAMAKEDAPVDVLRLVISELTRLVEIHGDKVWLIGAAARYETYSKLLNMFPCVDKDLGLQLLPITTLRLSTAESYPRSSLMESFVPFGGLFSSPSEMNVSLRSLDHGASCCHLCNEKCDEDVNVLSNGGVTTSVADHCPSNKPSWLRMTDFTTHSGLDVVKAKDDRVLSSTKIAGPHRNSDSMFQPLQCSQPSPKASSCQLGTQFTSVFGYQIPEDGKTTAKDDPSSPASTSSTQSDSKNIASFMSTDVQHFSTTKLSSPTNVNFLSKYSASESASKVIEDNGHSPPFSSTSCTAQDGLASPASVTSLTVDLNLGISSSSASTELEKPTNSGCVDIVQNCSSSLSANPESRNIWSNNTRSSSCSHPDTTGQLDGVDHQDLYRALAKRIGRQEEAVKIISHTIACCKATTERHHRENCADIWLNFVGPDRLAQKELAIALSEILHGSREHLIHVDLSFPDEMIHANATIDLQVWSDLTVVYRGKNVVDYIAGKLFKKPFSVLLLENVDKADLLVQSSLSKALKTGRFSDSHGREFGIGNAIFLTTSESADGDKTIYAGKAGYFEEDMSKMKGLPIQMLIGFDLGDYETSHNTDMLDRTSKGSSNRIFMNKRKLIGNTDIVERQGSLEMAKRAHRASNTQHLDLNVPAEEGEICDGSIGFSGRDSIPESSTTWLEDFLGQVDAVVDFKAFDFDAVAQKILEDISECFQKVVHSECSLEIDSRVMMQMVAAACLGDKRKVEDWVQHVLGHGFEEAQEKYSLTARSTVKLVLREGVFPEERTPAELLPSTIILN